MPVCVYSYVCVCTPPPCLGVEQTLSNVIVQIIGRPLSPSNKAAQHQNVIHQLNASSIKHHHHTTIITPPWLRTLELRRDRGAQRTNLQSFKSFAAAEASHPYLPSSSNPPRWSGRPPVRTSQAALPPPRGLSPGGIVS